VRLGDSVRGVPAAYATLCATPESVRGLLTNSKSFALSWFKLTLSKVTWSVAPYLMTTSAPDCVMSAEAANESAFPF
jgi:hypothetical protein